MYSNVADVIFRVTNTDPILKFQYINLKICRHLFHLKKLATRAGSKTIARTSYI